MMMKTMKKLDKKCPEYSLKLDTIAEDGSFKCPKCGVPISPDDESEENYKILDTKVLNNELSELVISCNKCCSIIKLNMLQ
jgi:predicted RNA-binding Zn-ribbon protein involved in translation (DUF1610 family)